MREVISRKSDVDRPGILSSLAYFMLGTNLLTILLWTVACLMIICYISKLYLFLALSTVGPTIGLLIHLPYILIAYLNDAAYATSIFIYYTIIVFVLFGALDLSFGTGIGAIISKTNGNNGRNSVLNNEADNRYPFFKHCNKKGIIVTFFIIIAIFTILIILLVGMIATAIIVIPISGSISDAPNRLLGFYQTVFILGGAYIVYRSFFKKKPALESVIKDQERGIFGNADQNERWRGLSNDEKVAEFYTHIMKIVGNINPNDPLARLAPNQQEQRQEAQTEDEEEASDDDNEPLRPK